MILICVPFVFKGAIVLWKKPKKNKKKGKKLTSVKLLWSASPQRVSCQQRWQSKHLYLVFQYSPIQHPIFLLGLCTSLLL